MLFVWVRTLISRNPNRIGLKKRAVETVLVLQRTCCQSSSATKNTTHDQITFVFSLLYTIDIVMCAPGYCFAAINGNTASICNNSRLVFSLYFFQSVEFCLQFSTATVAQTTCVWQSYPPASVHFSAVFCTSFHCDPCFHKASQFQGLTRQADRWPQLRHRRTSVATCRGFYGVDDTSGLSRPLSVANELTERVGFSVVEGELPDWLVSVVNQWFHPRVPPCLSPLPFTRKQPRADGATAKHRKPLQCQLRVLFVFQAYKSQFKFRSGMKVCFASFRHTGCQTDLECTNRETLQIDLDCNSNNNCKWSVKITLSEILH